MKNKIWLIIKVLFMILSLGSSIYFVYKLNELNMIPVKYFILISAGILIINIINILCLLCKKLVLNIIGIIISIIVVILACFAIKHVSNVSDFINKAFHNNDVEVTEYGIGVLTSCNYNELKDLNNKKIGYITFDENKTEYVNIIDSQITVEYKEYEDPEDLYNDLLKKKIDSIIISEGFVQILEEEHEDLKDNVRFIYNFEIEQRIENITKEIDSLEPINILISGSDSRTDKVLAKTRSDVNMIMTINPKEHKILLTSIPRDYYVKLHGTTGLKDKLTHSGIYGIDKTKKTIEDLFDIKIDYTIKIGFRSVVDIVDLIGGVDIDSDKAFTSHCVDAWAERTNVKEGWNHFTGPQALSYARERHAYLTGDNHRVQNQQQVLEAIINKICSDKSLLKKYDQILDSLKEFYRTDIPSSFIKLIISDQLNTNAGWTIEKQQVSGSGAMLHTYSMPGVKLWVMQPDMSSVNKAKNTIKKYYE